MNVKKHVQENKGLYIGLVVGIGIGVLIARNETVATAVKIQGLVNINPTINSEITTTLVRRGHPGFVVRNPETGELFASIKRAAELSGVSRGTIRGTFEILGEASA